MPQINLAHSINITRFDGGMAANLSWAVRPLDEVGGHVVFEIEYTQKGGNAKRQATDGCSQSPCRAPYDQGEVIVQGLDPDLPVTFDITAVNEDREEAMAVTLTAQR